MKRCLHTKHFLISNMEHGWDALPVKKKLSPPHIYHQYHEQSRIKIWTWPDDPSFRGWNIKWLRTPRSLIHKISILLTVVKLSKNIAVYIGNVILFFFLFEFLMLPCPKKKYNFKLFRKFIYTHPKLFWLYLKNKICRSHLNFKII